MIPMSPSRSSIFHLIIESSSPAQVPMPALMPAPAARRRDALALPDGVSILRVDEAPKVHSEPLELPDKELILEPVFARDKAPRLALVNAGNGQLWVNGAPASRFSLLREKDQFHFADSCAFHVTIFHRPKIGPAPVDKIGKTCSICLAPFTDDPSAVCYGCPCGTLLHLSDPRGLECARAVNECPHCKQPIALKPGYAWLPDCCHE